MNDLDNGDILSNNNENASTNVTVVDVVSTSGRSGGSGASHSACWMLTAGAALCARPARSSSSASSGRSGVGMAPKVVVTDGCAPESPPVQDGAEGDAPSVVGDEPLLSGVVSPSQRRRRSRSVVSRAALRSAVERRSRSRSPGRSRSPVGSDSSGASVASAGS